MVVKDLVWFVWQFWKFCYGFSQVEVVWDGVLGVLVFGGEKWYDYYVGCLGQCGLVVYVWGLVEIQCLYFGKVFMVMQGSGGLFDGLLVLVVVFSVVVEDYQCGVGGVLFVVYFGGLCGDDFGYIGMYVVRLGVVYVVVIYYCSQVFWWYWFMLFKVEFVWDDGVGEIFF